MTDCSQCGLMLEADGTCYVCSRDDASIQLDTIREDVPATRKAPSKPLPEKPAKVRLTSAARIPMKGTRWVYRGRIPHGMVTLLAGREGIGKSTVSLDIAARLTRGTLPGRYEGKPQNVIVCASEDSWSHTIKPRLVAVNADVERVFHVDVQNEDGSERSIVAPQDIRAMQEAFARCRPALLIIDPLMAVIDGKIDTHKQSEVQQALEPLVKMCDRTGMAVLALIHVNKSATTDPLTSIMGSKAFATLPRSILYCLEEDEGTFMFCHVKCNVGPKMPSIGYRLASVRFDLEPEDVEEGDDAYIESSRVVWGDEDARTASEMLEAKAGGGHLGPAAQAVLGLLDNEQGVLTTKQIHEKLPENSDAQIRNALSRLLKADRITQPARGSYQSTKIG
jgi:archaellum biogenesis ATPase FlaH